MDNRHKRLINGVEMPYVGLGVFKSPVGKETTDSVRWALEAGYGHIDTAYIYGNEESVGTAIQESCVKREEVFLTSKLWVTDVLNHEAEKGFLRSLAALRVDYFDLYLIHWPIDGFEQAWKDLEKLYKAGGTRAIGVSNFDRTHLERILDICEIKPMVNQVECHPYNTKKDLFAFCTNNQIACEAWSPLGGTGGNILQDKIISEIAKKYNKSAAQIIIRWNIQNQVVVIPKSVHKERIIQNIDVFDFTLEQKDMESIAALNKDLRVGACLDDVRKKWCK